MDWNCAVWHSNYVKNKEEAKKLYEKLCKGDTSLIGPTQRIQDFYEELTNMHPEIDDVSEEDINNYSICPWKCTFDKSEGHIMMSYVDCEAEYIDSLIIKLAQKYELSIYNSKNNNFI